jgi:hypothetical protein
LNLLQHNLHLYLELNDPEQEKKPLKCGRLLHYKEVPIDSINRCIEPENARNYENGKENH